MSGFRCLREIESALFNCWDRGFLSPGTLLPVGARCWIWEGFCGFCQITFSAAASVARLFMATPPTVSLEICLAWEPTLRDNDGNGVRSRICYLCHPVFHLESSNSSCPFHPANNYNLDAKRIPRCISNSKHCSVCHGSYKLWSNPVNRVKFGSQQDKCQAVQIGKKIFKSKFCDRQTLVRSFGISIISFKSRKFTLQYVFFGLGSTFTAWQHWKRSLVRAIQLLEYR